MAYLATAPDVSFGLVESTAVFLDVNRDLYAMLPPDLTEALAATLAHDGAIEPEDPMVRRFVATGLFALSDRPGPPAPTAHRPAVRGLADATRRSVQATDLVEVWRLLARAARGVRKSPFRAAQAPPRIAAAPATAGDRQAQIESLAGRFLRARTFVPIAPACLADSLALRTWLARRGVGCQLILAVRLEPFEAHCWIEAGGVVLNDAPERIATFTPVGVSA